jgi:leucyl-tRNA synthetase
MHSVSEKDSAKLEKEGVFSGSYAVNPANGERVPIWIGNFVLADYGSGMVMGVPAHDKRDFDFAKKYGIEIRQVVRNKRNGQNLNEAYVGEGEICNSGEFNKLDNEKAKEKITDWLISKNIAKRIVNFKLRDWGISRQRYWGTPIPIVYCEDCGAVPVPEKDLPVRLPKNVRFGDGNPLESNEEWLNVACPKCGKMGRRESDTMDTFVNSSWYFLRYCDSENSDKIFDFNKVKYWNPVDVYIGGAEHACMHLLYSRFYVKFLRDIGALDFDEPFSKLFHQGMLHAEDGRKMSKSLGNVVEPIETVAKYGVDATRWFLVSVASPDKDFDWSEKGIVGAKRFILKVAGFYDSFEEGKDSVELLSKLNLTIKNVEKYYDSFDYRKATIEIRELFRKMEGGCSGCMAEKFLKLIAPIVPHTAEELWETLHKKLKIKDKKLEEINLISNSEWPEADEEKILDKSCSEDLNSKIIERVKGIIKNDTKNVYVYVMPFEIGNIDALKISESVGCKVKVFAVNDSEKVDPEGWSKKAKPGMCSVWVK